MLDRDPMITGPQIEAARRLLRWSVSDLARRAGMEIADVQDIENATRSPKWRLQDLAIIRATLEDVGMEFIDAVGVHFRPPGLEGGIVIDRARPATNGSLT
jgi:transcriptional regulator with XRE-family HTH domain